MSKNYREKKGKMPKKERFIMIEQWVTRSDAWKELSPQEVRVLLLLLERFYGSNNGRISLSVREAAKHGKMAKKTAQKSLKRLVELGFIKVVFQGSFSQKIKDGSGRWYASEYCLTFKPYNDNLPTKEFRAWRPKKAVANKHRYGSNLRPIGNDGVI